jgi:hypothetical protein
MPPWYGFTGTLDPVFDTTSLRLGATVGMVGRLPGPARIIGPVR